MPIRRVVFGLIIACGTPFRAQSQTNTFDLRMVEANRDGDITYQNFIYVRSLADGRFLAQALFLRLAQAQYKEVAVAGGIRLGSLRDVTAYAMVGVASATDATYAEPALLLQDLTGRFTGVVYLQRYTPLEDAGIGQWLLDTFELQYAVRGPVFVGGAVYAYRPDGGDWSTKVGPKIGVTDTYGSTELRATRVTGGGTEFQLRRIVVF